MKATAKEWSSEVIAIGMEPETMEELLILLRYSVNFKKEAPSIYFSYNDGYMEITLKKVKESVQKRSKTVY